MSDRGLSPASEAFGSDLDDTGACCVRQSEQMTEIEIVGEDHEPMISRPRHDLPVFCFCVSYLRPVQGLDPVFLKELSP